MSTGITMSANATIDSNCLSEQETIDNEIKTIQLQISESQAKLIELDKKMMNIDSSDWLKLLNIEDEMNKIHSSISLDRIILAELCKPIDESGYDSDIESRKAWLTAMDREDEIEGDDFQSRVAHVHATKFED